MAIGVGGWLPLARTAKGCLTDLAHLVSPVRVVDGVEPGLGVVGECGFCGDDGVSGLDVDGAVAAQRVHQRLDAATGGGLQPASEGERCERDGQVGLLIASGAAPAVRGRACLSRVTPLGLGASTRSHVDGATDLRGRACLSRVTPLGLGASTRSHVDGATDSSIGRPPLKLDEVNGDKPSRRRAHPVRRDIVVSPRSQ